MTFGEVILWNELKDDKFWGFDFNRQRCIDNYIVDFYVKTLGLVIEIDGSSHNGKEEYDAQREAYLRSLGLRIFRIQVVDVMKQISMVMAGLEEYIIEEYGNDLYSVELLRSVVRQKNNIIGLNKKSSNNN